MEIKFQAPHTVDATLTHWLISTQRADTGDPQRAYFIPSGSPHSSSFRSIALNVNKTTFVAR